MKTTAARIAADYLKKILTARVYDVAIESPLEPAPVLSRRTGNQVLLKREDEQPVFSFKLRGAYNKMVQLDAEQRTRGVICASAGNHAQGVALAARKLGCTAVVVMPVTTPKLKIDAVKALGGEVVLHGESYSDAYGHAMTLQAERGLTFVHPFDDPDVIAGQGTVAMEILRQHQGPIDAVFVAIGGGGLISGVAAYIKAVRPEIQVIGVQTQDSDAMLRSVRAGRACSSTTWGCSPTARRSSSSARKPSASRASWSTTSWSSTPMPCAPRSRTCSRTRAASSSRPVRWAWRRSSSTPRRTRPEGTDLRRHHLRRQHELRPPALRRRARRVRRAARGAVRGDDPRGARQLQALLRADRPAPVTEFNYRISDAQVAHVFVGIAIQRATRRRRSRATSSATASPPWT
jgi:threonine dehydratase